jgi:hypothetical protein
VAGGTRIENVVGIKNVEVSKNAVTAGTSLLSASTGSLKFLGYRLVSSDAIEFYTAEKVSLNEKDGKVCK